MGAPGSVVVTVGVVFLRAPARPEPPLHCSGTPRQPSTFKMQGQAPSSPRSRSRGPYVNLLWEPRPGLPQQVGAASPVPAGTKAGEQSASAAHTDREARVPPAPANPSVRRPSRPRESQVGHTRVDGTTHLPLPMGTGPAGDPGGPRPAGSPHSPPGSAAPGPSAPATTGSVPLDPAPRQWVGEPPTCMGASACPRIVSAARSARTVRARLPHTNPSTRRPSRARPQEPQAGRTQADGPSPFLCGNRADQRARRPAPSRQPALTSTSGSAARAHPAPIPSKSIQLAPANTPMD
ncbi:hypothetical protein NDU88_005777 [Pleurodeles waltl]|uniref:Uncharacterized protein n=1 Tax=Pleurodeles waltl TaxID=8319 RepID=A0AAV7LM84_PLEWA|nr:hypothetical protein NDU88_005777 [Pleurodeles waltl]